MADRPLGRKKNVGSGGSGVHRRGEGLGGGPSGSGKGSSGSGKGLVDDLLGGSSGGSGNLGGLGGLGGMMGGSGGNSGGGRGKGLGLGTIVLIVAILFFVMRSGACSSGGSGLGSVLGGESAQTGVQSFGQNNGGYSQQDSGLSQYSSLFGGSATPASWEDGDANTGKLDTSVAAGSRAKRTRIIGGGKDQVTVMVYMCGTDLESRSAMGSRDLQEMAKASLGDNLNVIVYTGGCSRWQINGISNDRNQIYQVKNGNLIKLEDDMGRGTMTDPKTLTTFIQWTAKNYPANRYELIFWDHGGGSNSGYGYDEKNRSAGSMTLAGINTALKNGGITYDFIGFDACLMATVETAMVCGQYADYMIASEETEPGVGWYYTDWLTALSQNSSMPTLEIGKKIVDTYTSACASTTPGQSTTLSVVDLAELQATIPSSMTAFAKSTSELIENKEYKTVSNARSGAREFAQSSRIDQVDLVHLAKKMGTEEGEQLASALLGAIKYNQTSAKMTNSYGLSVYFPYKKASSVDQMVNTYEAIGMDEEYTKCIQEFASLGVAGQVASGGSATSSPMSGLFGSLLGGGSSSGSSTAGGGADLISSLLGQYMSGGFSGISGLDASNTGFFGRSMSTDQMAEYIADNMFDPSQLTWNSESGTPSISISEDQWSLVQNLDLAMFYDDGTGYVDLGQDNVFEFDDTGALLAPTDRTWLAIDGQIVAYYRLDAVGDEDNYTITGRVPAELNGEPVNLIIVFDTEHPDGYIAGANYDYKDGETETVAKNLTELQPGDQLDFICDYYDYDGNFSDRYYLGETMTVSSPMEEILIDNRDVGEGGVRAAYRFTDIYDQAYWTEFLDL